MNKEKYITKSIAREANNFIAPLTRAYSEKLGVEVSQADAIGLAIKNEYKRNVKVNG